MPKCHHLKPEFFYFSPKPLYITHPKLFIRDTALDKDIHPTDVWMDKVEATARQATGGLLDRG
jgi:hypothetical protein